MYIFLNLLLIFLAIVGLSNLVLSLVYSLSKVKNDGSFLLVIPKIEESIDAEFAIRSVVAKTHRLGKNTVQKIIVLDDRLDKGTKKECELICKEYDFVYLMDINELYEFLKNK